MRFIALSLTLLFTFTAANQRADDNEGWQALFNGENLNNFVQRNGTATYRVQGDMIVGRTAEGSPNSFLCTKQDYGDFELKFEVLLVDPELNSGVQFRSQSKPERDNGRVHGPQVEISTDGKAGNVYGEALDTGWLNEADPQPHKYFNPWKWNRYVVRCEGKTIKTWLNDQPIADFTDERSGMEKGFIGLQVHGIAAGSGPYEVRWRNIYIRELPAK